MPRNYVSLFGSGGDYFPTLVTPDVALDTSNGVIATGAVAVADVTLTVANNANRALVACVANDVTLTTSGVAYTAGSGGAFAQLGTLSVGARIYYIFSSIAPSTGSVTVRATYSGNFGAGDGNMVLYSVYNVDQTTPVDTYTANAAPVVTLAVNTATGNLVIVHLGASSNPGALITGTQDYSNSGNSFWRAGHNTGASSATVAWTTDANGRGIHGCNVRKA